MVGSKETHKAEERLHVHVTLMKAPTDAHLAKQTCERAIGEKEVMVNFLKGEYAEVRRFFHGVKQCQSVLYVLFITLVQQQQ